MAVAGKGGAGKTTVSASLARLAARRGRAVVAIDGDSNPNLALAMGTPPPDHGLPAGIVSRRFDGPALASPLDAILEQHTTEGGDGVRVALMGAAAHAHEGCLCSAHATVSAVLDALGRRDEILTVLDLEASPEHFSRGTARHVDVLVLVTEPYYRSLETTRRMSALGAQLPVPRIAVVANKIRTPGDADAIAEFCARHGLELAVTIPWSDAITEADRLRVPFVDHADAGDAALVALTSLLDQMVVGPPARTASR